MDNKLFSSPQEIYLASHDIGFKKAQQRPLDQLFLSIAAGIYLSFGGMFSLSIGGGLPNADPGIRKLLFAAVFPIGLVLIIIVGAELLTGNLSLLMPPLLSKSTSLLKVLQNWTIVFFGNFIGSLFVVLLIWASEILADDPWASFAANIADTKINLPFQVAFFRAILANYLVCLAIQMSIGAKDILSKIVAIWFPIMTFVASSYEHSIANQFLVPMGLMLGAKSTFLDFLWKNLLPVLLGNIVGGGLFVGTFYWWMFDYRSRSLGPS